MKRYTSAETAKLLRTLNEEYEALKDRERQRSEFVAAVGEDVESVRPPYDYQETQDQLLELEEKIRQVKHGINCFNVSMEVPGCGMSVDQALVYIPQLSARKRKLASMMNRLPKQREESGYRNAPIIEYNYANYSIEDAERDYRAVSEELARVQTALDVLNNSERGIEISF